MYKNIAVQLRESILWLQNKYGMEAM